MSDLLTEAEVTEARELRLEAMHLQEMQDNPLDAEQIAMFELFERERWSHERRIAHLAERAKARAKTSLAAE